MLPREILSIIQQLLVFVAESCVFLKSPWTVSVVFLPQQTSRSLHSKPRLESNKGQYKISNTIVILWCLKTGPVLAFMNPDIFDFYSDYFPLSHLFPHQFHILRVSAPAVVHPPGEGTVLCDQIKPDYCPRRSHCTFP